MCSLEDPCKLGSDKRKQLFLAHVDFQQAFFFFKDLVKRIPRNTGNQKWAEIICIFYKCNVQEEIGQLELRIETVAKDIWI